MLNLNDVKQMLTQADENTLTVYLNVDNALQENQATIPAWQIWLRDALEETGKGISKDHQVIWREAASRVNDYLSSYRPSAKTIVLFAGPGFDGVQTYELSLPLENQISFGAPNVGPLLWIIDEYEPYLIVLVDQEEARFFTSVLGSVGFQDSVERGEDISEWRDRTIMSNPGPGVDHGAVHGGSGRDDYEKRMDEQRSRLYRDVAAHVEKLVQQHTIDRVIFGGAEQSAHSVVNLLPEKMKSSVVGVLSVPLRSTSEQIFEQMLPAALDFERQQELQLVQDVIGFAKARGRGALGPQAVREAMDMQRVELLIMSWPAANEQLATELSLRTLSLNASIELVHGEAGDLLNAEGNGVAARLYYAL